MKSKKLIIGMIVFAIFIAQISMIPFNNFVYAEEKTCEISITGTKETVNLQKLEPGDEFEVSVNIDALSNVGKGIVSLIGQLEYDANLLERKSITGKNGWSMPSNFINEKNLKFITDNDNGYVVEAGEIFTIRFKVKETVAEATSTIIKIKGITASGGEGIVRASDAELGIGIQMPVIPPVEEKITSDVYIINNEDKDISRIAPRTTVTQFKNNVETEQEMVFVDSQGNVLGEDSIIASGMKIKVGKTLEYTLIVTGDLDNDGTITVNDLAQIKLHLIDYEKLTGIYLKAANLDLDGDITVNDAAQIKLVLINLMEIK